MKKSLLFLFVSFVFMCVADNAFAGNADPIFDNLADKAGTIGKGLRDSGFLIAGFGLIVFSFMAIFNKISWKMLAYIMFSTFVLSTMIGVISYISDGQSGNPFPDIQSTGPGGESMDPTQAQVDKNSGKATVGTGTAPVAGGTLPEVVITGQKRNGDKVHDSTVYKPEDQFSKFLNTPWNKNNQNTAPEQQQPEQPSWKVPWQ